jgi:hypothetical protein
MIVKLPPPNGHTYDAQPRERGGLRPIAALALERVLFALARTMTLLSAALAVVVSPWFLLLAVSVEVLERSPRGGFLGWRS